MRFAYYLGKSSQIYATKYEVMRVLMRNDFFI